MNSDAVALAKRNIQQFYLSIGLLEELPAFLATLEYLLPDFFAGIGALYKETGKVMYNYQTCNILTSDLVR